MSKQESKAAKVPCASCEELREQIAGLMVENRAEALRAKDFEDRWRTRGQMLRHIMPVYSRYFATWLNVLNTSDDELVKLGPALWADEPWPREGGK